MDTEREECSGKYSLIEDPAFKQAFPAAGIKRNIFRLSVHAFGMYSTNLKHSQLDCQVFE